MRRKIHGLSYAPWLFFASHSLPSLLFLSYLFLNKCFLKLVGRQSITGAQVERGRCLVLELKQSEEGVTNQRGLRCGVRVYIVLGACTWTDASCGVSTSELSEECFMQRRWWQQRWRNGYRVIDQSNKCININGIQVLTFVEEGYTCSGEKTKMNPVVLYLVWRY